MLDWDFVVLAVKPPAGWLFLVAERIGEGLFEVVERNGGPVLPQHHA
jgi:hypothetical protein